MKMETIVSIESKRVAIFSKVAPTHQPTKARKRHRNIEPKKVYTVKGLTAMRKSPAKMETREIGKTGMARERKRLNATFLPRNRFSRFSISSQSTPKNRWKRLTNAF